MKTMTILKALTFCYALSTVNASHAQMTYPQQIDLWSSIIDPHISALSQIPALEFAAVSEITFSREFLDRNPQVAPSDKALTYYYGVLAADKYRISSVAWAAAKGWTPEFIATYDGITWNYLDPEGSSRLQISKTFVTDPDGGMNLGSTLLLPYAFLFENKQSINLPFITLSRVIEKERWAKAIASSTILQNSANGDLRVRFELPNKVVYLVTFSQKDNYYPVALEKYSPDGIIAVRYSVNAIEKLTYKDKPAPFPKDATLEVFSQKGISLFTVKANLTRLAHTVEPALDFFQMDPASVEAVYDLDNHVQITIPR
jgi:hypothetical protein